MTEITVRRATPADLDGILEILRRNHVENLSAEERDEGFLSAQFSREQLTEMINDIGIVVACDRDGVVGFLCATRPEFDHGAPIIKKMLDTCSQAEYDGQRLRDYRPFIYGPVCIEQSHRGQGLLSDLFEKLTRLVADQFEIGIAFVAHQNPHSLAAHTDGLGMTAVRNFEWNDDEYALLAFPVPLE
jgi:L-amino acid N-acyltransferase YncA